MNIEKWCFCEGFDKIMKIMWAALHMIKNKHILEELDEQLMVVEEFFCKKLLILSDE